VLEPIVPPCFRSLLLAAALVGVTSGTLGAQDASQRSAPRVINLAAARDRPGLFTQRLLLPANYCGDLHIHDRDLHGLVVAGILRMGFVDSAGRLEVREHPAGSFVVVLAGQVHVEGSAGETEIHLSGIGPLVTTVVDSGGAQRCTPGAPK
jgi:hypothetical protein